jgi:hypothetical protein
LSCVYALVAESDQDNIRYIGRAKNPNGRLRNHLRFAEKGRKEHVYNWINKVKDKGDKVKLIIIEDDLTWEESAAREIHYIAYYRSLGFDLTNMTSGGDGRPGYVISKETREKIGKYHRGKVLSDETKQKIRDAKIGKKVSDETKAKISNSTRNISPKGNSRQKHAMTDEVKAKISRTLVINNKKRRESNDK